MSDTIKVTQLYTMDPLSLQCELNSMESRGERIISVAQMDMSGYLIVARKREP